jgi:glycosyltransferase involved in cell wall biosynthesis
MPPSFSVIVPTKGRDTLSRTLATVADQLDPGDEILVVCNHANDWGNSARQSAMDRAKGDYIAFVDDDDIFVPGALEAMRSWARDHPGRIGIFKRKSDAWAPQPREPVLKQGMVCPQNFLIPNIPGKLGRWGEQSQDPALEEEIAARNGRHWSDVFFVQETAELQGTEPIFVDVITGYARPIGNPIVRLRYRLNLRRRLRGLVPARSS